jgi:spermidine/putrescine-binding protein
MSGRYSRREAMRFGAGAAAGLAAAGLPVGIAVGQSAGTLKGPLNGSLFCHTMGKAEDIAKFKAEAKVEANVTCWTSNTDTLTKIASGGGKTFDVFNISMQFIPPLIQRGLVAPLDLSKVPNAQHLAPMFAKPEWSTVGGKQYSLPFMFGYDSVLYNKKKLDHVDSYAVLFDDKYKGQISIRDDPQLSIIQTALFLGYDNPFKLSAKDLKDISDFLIKKKGNFRKLWTGFAEAVSLMKSEEVIALGDGWIAMAWTLRKDGMDVGLALPKEKVPVWTHDWLMPKEAVDRGMAETVYAYMNWSLGADQAANMGRSVGYVSPSLAGLKLLTAEEAKTIGYDTYEAVWKNGVPMLETPANIQEWNDAWSRFKAA